MKHYLIAILTLVSFYGFSQLQPLKGIVIATDDVEGIHVLNKTSVKYTVTDTDGSFKILVKVNDTLTISSLKYETKNIKITPELLAQNNLNVFLSERITQLDEVVIGKILTGSLMSDLDNLDVKAKINAEDLGIPGYFGKPKTLNERKLADADGGGWGSVSGGPYGGGVGLNFHKILNRISGRTKKLKERVARDNKDKCRIRLKKEFQNRIFENEKLTQAQQADYFYFCMDAPNFQDICSTDDFQKIEQFLQKKLRIYKANLAITKD